MVVFGYAAVGLFVFDWWKCVCSKMFLLEGCFEEQLWIIGGGEYKMDDKMRDDITHYNIGPDQLFELENIKEFLKVNHFKPVKAKGD